jgi:hypothetical protein
MEILLLTIKAKTSMGVWKYFAHRSVAKMGGSVRGFSFF